MRQFLLSNTTWLYRYFEKNKSLFEIFSFLMVAQTFMYSGDLGSISRQSVSAFQIILWLLIFLIIILLQISTSVELRNDMKLIEPIFKGANFMKTIMRLLTFVLLIATVPIFIQQVTASVHNKLFSVFYGTLGIVSLIEIIAFVSALTLRRIQNLPFKKQ